eukprot:1843367-Pyramimonas_sp.AAC.1
MYTELGSLNMQYQELYASTSGDQLDAASGLAFGPNLQKSCGASKLQQSWSTNSSAKMPRAPKEVLTEKLKKLCDLLHEREKRKDQVDALSPSASGARYGSVLSPLTRLGPATGIFSLPFRDWCLLRV